VASRPFVAALRRFRLPEKAIHSRSENVPSTERRKELKRRRHRRKKVAQFARKLPKATVSERAAMAEKLRSMTPGGQVIVDRWELEKR
jgi:hypothetical protein